MNSDDHFEPFDPLAIVAQFAAAIALQIAVAAVLFLIVSSIIGASRAIPETTTHVAP